MFYAMDIFWIWVLGNYHEGCGKDMPLLSLTITHFTWIALQFIGQFKLGKEITLLGIVHFTLLHGILNCLNSLGHTNSLEPASILILIINISYINFQTTLNL